MPKKRFSAKHDDNSVCISLVTLGFEIAWNGVSLNLIH
jgi:hypothetical protein